MYSNPRRKDKKGPQQKIAWKERAAVQVSPFGARVVHAP